MVITKAHKGKNRMLSRVVSTTLSAANCASWPISHYICKWLDGWFSGRKH